jgi:hypothetical protein
MTWFDVAMQIPGIDLAYVGVEPESLGDGSCPGGCSHRCGWDQLCLPFETATARHTARRVLPRLVHEHDAGELSYSMVRDYLARRRPEIWAAASCRVGEAFVARTHESAAEARSASATCGSCCAGSIPDAIWRQVTDGTGGRATPGRPVDILHHAYAPATAVGVNHSVTRLASSGVPEMTSVPSSMACAQSRLPRPSASRVVIAARMYT